jgi:tetratricopeptide (TPR) repeat protein
MTRRLALLLTLTFTFTVACAGAEKIGDRAAATGDWRTAERQYAAAVQKDPQSPELRAKWQQARAEALAGAFRKAQGCGAAQDWECAYAESSYAMSLDDARADVVAFQRDAALQAAHLRVRRAAEATERADFRNAYAFLASAQQVSADPGVAARARAVEPRLVRGSVAEAERLRASRDYPAALELLGLAAGLDGTVRPRLAAVRAENEAWLDAEHARLVADGDALVDAGRFADAQAAYTGALRFRKLPRTEALASWAAGLAAGDAATQARDWPRAEHAFADAARLGVDRNGVAATMLERVRVRPYVVAVRGLRVRPTWGDVKRLFTSRLRDQPHLGLEIDLPDGRRIATGTRRTLDLVLDARFVVESNHYDDRPVTFRAIHDDGRRRHELGVVTIPLADLVARPDAAFRDDVIAELRVRADATDQPEGAFSGAAPVPDATNLAPAWSMPSRHARGHRLVHVEGIAAATAAVDLQIELLQRGAVVYQSPVTRAPTGATSWSPAAAYLFLESAEDVTVRLLDARNPGAPLLAMPLSATVLANGHAELASPSGVRVRIRLAPREAGPASAAVTRM